MANRICPKCRRPLGDNDLFCSSCGTAVPREAPRRRCPRCGAKLPAGARFCGKCGAPIDGAGEKRPRNKAVLMAAIGAPAVLILLVLAGILLSQDRPAAPADTGTASPETGAPSAISTPAEEVPAPWAHNVLVSNPIQGESMNEIWTNAVFGSELTREDIYTVTFLDTLDGQTEDSWDAS